MRVSHAVATAFLMTFMISAEATSAASREQIVQGLRMDATRTPLQVLEEWRNSIHFIFLTPQDSLVHQHELLDSMLPAIVEHGTTLLMMDNTSPICCSDSTLAVVRAWSLAPHKPVPDGRAWTVAETNRDGENLLADGELRRNLTAIHGFLLRPGVRLLSSWAMPNASLPDLSALPAYHWGFEMKITNNRKLRYLSGGRLQLISPSNRVRTTHEHSPGMCLSPDPSASSQWVACEKDLNLESAWSDSATRTVVLRLSQNSGCDGCEAQPKNRVVRVP